MFKQRLMGALSDALGHCNNGSTELEAVTKSAADNNFNPDQTRRLVESFNTFKSLNHLKTADDRASHYTTVEPSHVINGIFGKEAQAKQAAAKVAPVHELAPNSYQSFYDGGTAPGMAKAASSNWEPKVTTFDAPTPTQVADQIQKKRAAYKRQAEHAEADAGMKRGHYELTVAKLANHLDADMYTAEKRADIMRGIVMSYPDGNGAHIVNSLNTLMHHKLASATFDELPRFNKAPSTYPSVFAKVATLIDDIAAHDTNMAKAAAYTTAVEKLDDITGYKRAQDEFDKAAELGTKTLFEIPGRLHEQVEKGISKSKEVLTPKADEPSKAQQRGEVTLQNLKRQIMLQDLLANDEVLAGADPEQVRSIYQEYVTLAPEQSTQKELVRSVLRQGINSPGGLSPFDAKALADVQATIKKGK